MGWGTVFILIQVLIATTCAAEIDSTCDPSQSCRGQNAGFLVIDPEDCHNYYVCITTENGNVLPSDNPLTCPHHYYFDGAECVDEIYPCANPCANRDCKVGCEPDSPEHELTAYPNDCNKYFLCMYGTPTIQECPADAPYFNGKKCVEEKYECCDLCTPYCKDANTEVMDPDNCKRYYLCLENNIIPTDDYHFTCEKGSYFNPDTGHCDLENEQSCVALCDNTTFPSFA